MGRKRSERTVRRALERDARQLVRDREKLAALSRGGAATHPIEVTSTAVIEVRLRSLACPQCNGEYKLHEHDAAGTGLRRLHVRCVTCGVARDLWFRLVSDEPN